MSAETGSCAVDRSVFRLPLQTQHFSLEPLKASDFDDLYAVASDSLLWEQHPEADRWKRSKFRQFFQGGLANDLGCFVVREKQCGRAVGSSRFYGYEVANTCIRIGYTFIAREFWGTSANRELKEVMLLRAFKVTDRVFFDIGPHNFRSIAAVKKLGAVFSHNESDSKAVFVLSQQQWFNTASGC
jgi:RimJ/RimL family protein N-acetyltransferase